MFVQDLALLNNREVQIIDTFLPQRTKQFVRISEKFELKNFELSDGLCNNDLIANAHGTKQFVRIIFLYEVFACSFLSAHLLYEHCDFILRPGGS